METQITEHEIKLRTLTIDDYADLHAITKEIYGDMGGEWPKESIIKLFEVFPEGQICIVDKDKAVAFAFSIMIHVVFT